MVEEVWGWQNSISLTDAQQAQEMIRLIRSDNKIKPGLGDIILTLLAEAQHTRSTQLKKQPTMMIEINSRKEVNRIGGGDKVNKTLFR